MSGEAFGLYTHIRNNRIRSRLLLAGLFLLAWLASFGGILAATGFTGTPRGVDPYTYALNTFIVASPFITVGVAIWIFIGYQINVAIIGAVTGARGLERAHAPKLYGMLENLCISRGITMPKLMIIEDQALNAFASGVKDSQFTVTVTRGLLDHLDDAEIEAVLAHELTHIRNGDVKLMVVAVVIAGVLSFLSEVAFRSMRFSGSSSRSSSDNKGAGAAILIGLLIMAVAGILASVIRFSLSRSREYLADAGAVELTKNPDAMISALLKISGRADIAGVPSGIMDMCIENDPDDMSDIFSTHPSISKRVQALVGAAGGRLPPRLNEMSLRPPLTAIVEARGPWGVRHPNE
ncbi:MAG: M48 family metallopeptidase [Bosea sp. (in: a-proteobacteria)]|jgi:heat shock protein HtpX